MVVAVVGTSFQHSGVWGSIKSTQSCVHCSERSHFSPSPSPSTSSSAYYSWDEDVSGSAPYLVVLPSAATCLNKIRLGLLVNHRQKPRAGRIFLCHGAQILPEPTSVQSAAAEGVRGRGGRGRGQPQYRRGGPNAPAAVGATNSGEGDETEKEGVGIATAEAAAAEEAAAANAKAATMAVEESTKDMVEKFAEESLRMDGIRSKTNGRGRSSSEPSQEEDVGASSSSDLTDDERFLRRAAVALDADAVQVLIAERELPSSRGGGCVSNEDCSRLILAATAHDNAELAFSILNAMRTGLRQKEEDRTGEKDSSSKGRNWSWPRPDVGTYVALVRGLAASLRVSDAIQTISDVRRRGVPLGDEVPFGKVVNCPTCKTSLTVVQPQHGIQLVPCSKCRYKYELVSGVIVNSESESISSSIPFWQRGLQMLPFRNRGVSAAVHSVVVRAPDGVARTHRFATESPEVPAQEGERVTLVLASPGKVGRGVGPIRFNARAPGWQPREPMAVTNHVTGKVLSLGRAPASASGAAAGFNTSILLPAALILASTDAASGLIDPSLPSTIAIGAAAALVLGGAANTILLPRLNQLPERTVGAIALRQRLLAQHEQLQRKLAELTEAASDEVRMLARMCQLQNKMEAVGEASYSARIERVRKAREGLDERLSARLELMDSYAKVASMIEIEVEMDIDVLAAEAASPEATIAEQIESLMDVERLQKEWKNQAEANDEVERLLRSPLLPS